MQQWVTIPVHNLSGSEAVALSIKGSIHKARLDAMWADGLLYWYALSQGETPPKKLDEDCLVLKIQGI